jgi:methionyl-tRNA formyltransferase
MQDVRIVLCTFPGVYSDVVLSELIRAKNVRLVGVVRSTRILKKQGPKWLDDLRMLQRTGLHYSLYLFMVTGLYSLLRRLFVKDDVDSFLQRNNIPILKTNDINSPEGIEFVSECRPDIMLSVHFNQLIGERALVLPRWGCLNIHPGRLPEYRGVDPLFYAVLRKDSRVGVTLHFQDQGFDTGNVLAEASIAVRAEDSLLSLNLKLFRAGTGLLLEKLGEVSALGKGIAQVKSDAYDSWPDSLLVSEFHGTGRKLIDLGFYLQCLKWVG